MGVTLHLQDAKVRFASRNRTERELARHLLKLQRSGKGARLQKIAGANAKRGQSTNSETTIDSKTSTSRRTISRRSAIE
jgi:hypothetical protein